MDEDVKGETISELSEIDFSWEVLLNQPNNGGNTPLHLATFSRSIACVCALTNARVDKTARNNMNLTAYDIARYLYKSSSQQKSKFLDKWRKIIKTVCPDEKVSLQSREPSLWIKTLVPKFVPIAKEDEEDKDDEKYRKRVSKTHMLVATLIATVSLAAAFQIPGGYETAGETKGMAVLAGKTAFRGFVIADMIALSCSVLTLVLYFFADIFDIDNPPKFRTIAICGFLILLAVTFMMEAFACAMVSVLPRTHSSWVKYLTTYVCISIPAIGLLLAWWFHQKKDDKFLKQNLISMVDGDA
ncbi:ankyrin repeat-containing protein At2g01680-like [Macadamia integrifolia]|uniref:ankyrin repeat-containing protein At2g01680-like n=1 Tax=Macadamia integrifolia TaxID=60698 RepID=UPI001C4ECD38|nr:ankyrin repeat-containing protein At2g01680-like [Macadamia integrifolia]